MNRGGEELPDAIEKKEKQRANPRKGNRISEEIRRSIVGFIDTTRLSFPTTCFNI